MGYIYLSSAESLWQSDEWFYILASLFAHMKQAVRLCGNRAPNVTGAARNQTFPRIEWSLSGQIWPRNRITCPCTHAGHPFILILRCALWTSPYFRLYTSKQQIRFLSCLKERSPLYEWAIESSKHRREGEKQKCDWPRQTSLQYRLPGAISEG